MVKPSIRFTTAIRVPVGLRRLCVAAQKPDFATAPGAYNGPIGGQMTQLGTGLATVQTGRKDLDGSLAFCESRSLPFLATRSYVERAKETCFRNTETGGAPAS